MNMANGGHKRIINFVKVGYCVAIIFGTSIITFQFFNIGIQQRCYRDYIPSLSFLARKISMHLSETEWKKLQEMVERWRAQQEDGPTNPNPQGSESTWDSCQPRRNIFFLKTHKTASSTIMNILFRYGESHNLTFALPIPKFHFDYTKFFSTSSVAGFSAKKRVTYNIMCHHMRFSLTEVEKVMPRDTFYFTILRNPITLMESSFAYYKETVSFLRAKDIESFINNTPKFYQSQRLGSNYAKNLLTFDLGFDNNGPESPKQYKLLTQTVDTIFDLVLITEYFDESLVLLKDALCWTFDDVLSFPLNIRSNTSRKVLSEETKEKIKSWNQLDWQLYVHFNNSFWNRVERFGIERMEEEVKELRKRREQLSEKCLDAEVNPSQLKDKSMIPYQSGMAEILGYNLKPGLQKDKHRLCHRLILPELQYSELLWSKQVKTVQRPPLKKFRRA